MQLLPRVCRRALQLGDAGASHSHEHSAGSGSPKPANSSGPASLTASGPSGAVSPASTRAMMVGPNQPSGGSVPHSEPSGHAPGTPVSVESSDVPESASVLVLLGPDSSVGAVVVSVE